MPAIAGLLKGNSMALGKRKVDCRSRVADLVGDILAVTPVEVLTATQAEIKQRLDQLTTQRRGISDQLRQAHADGDEKAATKAKDAAIPIDAEIEQLRTASESLVKIQTDRSLLLTVSRSLSKPLPSAEEQRKQVALGQKAFSEALAKREPVPSTPAWGKWITNKVKKLESAVTP
jgi:seryl-tRNA synthetase